MDLSQYNGGAGYAPQASESNDGEGFTPIPPGWYSVRASRAEVRDNYDKDGMDLDITLDITGPTHAGRKIFKKIRQSGASADATKRDKAMGNVAAALGLTTPLTATEQIEGATFDAKVTAWNDKNYAHDLQPAGTHTTGQAAPAQQTAPPAWTPPPPATAGSPF